MRKGIDVERNSNLVSDPDPLAALRRTMLSDSSAQPPLDRPKTLETQIRFLADSIPLIIWTATADGKLEYCNKFWLDYSGMTFEQTAELGYTAIMHPDDVEQTKATREQVFARGESCEATYRLKRAADAVYRWQLGRVVPLRDEAGRIVRWLGTCTDIHERRLNLLSIQRSRDELELRVQERTAKQKQQEAQLREAKRFAESVADQSPFFIYIRDLRDEKLAYVNRATSTFLGWPTDRMPRPELTSPQAFFHPDDMGALRAAREVIKTLPDGEVFEFTARFRHVSGEWRMMLNRHVVFDRDANGRPTQIMGTAQDITALVKTQEELKLAKEAAEAATRTKSEFLANMSHEIRTPMTAILGYTNLLTDPKQTDQQRSEHAQVIKRNGEHLLEVLNDILDISRIEAGKMAVELRECDPSEIVNEVKTLMMPLAADKNLSFGIDVREHLPRSIVTDPTRLKQILLNLVGNAIKFTERGSVRVLVRTEEAGSSQRLRFDVSDTGIGIAAHLQSNLFTAFAQSQSSMNRRFGGSGLGLAICKKLANMLGGDLAVASEVGEGSTFTLFLNVETSASKPAVSTSPAMAGPTASTAKRRLAGRILLAEDTLDTRRLVTSYLEEAGASVEAVSNGFLAVDAVDAKSRGGKPFDVVLMDMQMPDLDGYDATIRLRAMGFKDVPIIAFTAHAMADARDRCLRIGCSDHLTKPIDFDRLLDVVGRYVGHLQPPSAAIAGNRMTSAKLNSDLVQMLLNDYISSLPQQVAQIESSLASNDLSALRLGVHRLRGSGGCFGFADLSRLAEKAEESIEACHAVEHIAGQVKELVQLVRSVEGYDRGGETPLLAKPLE
jgi:PAS domain S-box-containing protein